MRNHGIYIALIILFSISAFSQSALQPSPDTHEAWTVEYVPYKVLVQDAVTKYRSASDENAKALGPINRDDKIIIIRSQLEKDIIYELWYGGGSDFEKISTEMVNWVFGATLQSVLLERQSYFNIGTNDVFDSEEKNRSYDFLVNNHSWANSDYELALSTLKLKIEAFGSENRAVFRWGNPTIGLPHSKLGTFSAGILSKNYEIGIHFPAPLDAFNEVVLEENTEQEGLVGGMGGYGSFNYEAYGAELGFSALPIKNKKFTENYANEDTVHLVDYFTTGYMNFKIPERVLKPSIGSIVLRFGGSVYRVVHYAIQNEVVRNAGNDYLGGIYARLESAWFYNTSWEKPYLELAYQQIGSEALMFEFTIRPIKSLAIPLLYHQSMNERAWAHPKTLSLGVQLSFDL